MDKDTLQLNKRQLLDYEVSANAYKDIYKDLYKEFNRGKVTYDNNEIIEFINSSVLSFYHIPRPDNMDDFDLQMEGIICKDVKIDDKILNSGMTPFLCTFKENGDYVMLVPRKFLGYYYILPNGVKKKVEKDFICKLNKEAKAFYKGFKPIKLGLSDLVNYLFSIIYPSDILVYFIAIALVTCFGFFIPMINQYIFSFIDEDPLIKNLIFIIVVLLIVSTIRLLLEGIKRIMQKRVILRQSTFVNTATMYRILTLPATFFRKNLSGELSYRLQFINNVCNSILGVLIDTTVVAIFSITYLFQIQYFDKNLLLPSVVVILASCLVNIACSIIKAKYMKKVMNVSSSESGLSYNIITGMEKIRLTGSERRAFAVWAKEYRKLINIKYFPPFLILHCGSILKAIELIGFIAFYLICIGFSVSKANYIAFLSSFGMLSMSFLNLSNISQVVADIKTSIDFIRPIIEESPEPRKNKKIVEKLKGSIVFSNVSFGYDNDKNVFNNLSFNIKEGEYVSIVGPSGSGKSTIIRLILGFEKIRSGAIYVDNFDIRNYEPSSYRRNIGSVLQNEKLYSMNIKSNIRMANSNATEEDINNALKKAEFYDELKSFPMGLNTIVADNYGVSSGQKQRILLARCFVTNNNIMIFDEATNALDVTTEKKVFETIKNLKCTRIVVAHTFSSMKDCDKIIVLDGGKVAEIGKYDELVEKKKVFYNLINAKKE